MKLQIFWMWIISWLLIIIIHAIVIKRYDISSVYSMHFKEEIVNDGNNLFSTGLVYFIATLICHFLSISICSLRASIAILLWPYISAFKQSNRKYSKNNCFHLWFLSPFDVSQYLFKLHKIVWNDKCHSFVRVAFLRKEGRLGWRQMNSEI